MTKPMTVRELKERLDEYPDDYVVKIDPPYSDVRSVIGGRDDGIVELGH